MNKEKYSCYEFEVRYKNQWVYKILHWNDYLCCEDNIESGEWYETEDEAREAAIEHIDRLENGEG